MSDEQETLLEFPCQFSVKAMGLAAADFDSIVVQIVRRHAPDMGEGSVRVRPSSGGKYLSVTVTFEATSKDQLDAIYQDLTDHDRILMSL
jgi:putative lipoic acid-binding regulatory protein